MRYLLLLVLIIPVFSFLNFIASDLASIVSKEDNDRKKKTSDNKRSSYDKRKRKAL